MEKLGEILNKSLKRLDLSPRLDEYGVWPIWNDIVGATIARNAQPEKIRNGTLFVKVSGATWMQELQYMKEMISQKLNQSLGREVVKNIFFFVGKLDAEAVKSKSQGSAPSSPSSPTHPQLEFAEEHLRSIKDPEIRRALRRLFTAHARKEKK
jgi:predicted nucleic acid-binding Zn ribbon protein